jgi:hypothetical protein
MAADVVEFSACIAGVSPEPALVIGSAADCALLYGRYFSFGLEVLVRSRRRVEGKSSGPGQGKSLSFGFAKGRRKLSGCENLSRSSAHHQAIGTASLVASNCLWLMVIEIERLLSKAD